MFTNLILGDGDSPERSSCQYAAFGTAWIGLMVGVFAGWLPGLVIMIAGLVGAGMAARYFAAQAATRRDVADVGARVLGRLRAEADDSDSPIAMAG